MKRAISEWSVSSDYEYGCLVDKLRGRILDDICTPGANDSECAKWVDLLGFSVDNKWASGFRKSYGLGDQVGARNLAMFVLWCAAWDAFENQQ